MPFLLQFFLFQFANRVPFAFAFLQIPIVFVPFLLVVSQNLFVCVQIPSLFPIVPFRDTLPTLHLWLCCFLQIFRTFVPMQQDQWIYFENHFVENSNHRRL